MPNWETIKGYIVAFGWAKGVLTLFFFMAHGWVYKLYQDRVKDKQAEIDRLAADNREYRERYLFNYDQHFGYKSKGKGGEK